MSRWDEVRASIGRVLAVARFSVREAIHGRSFVIGGLLSLVWLGIVALLGWFAFSNISSLAGYNAGDPQTVALVRAVVTHFLVSTAVGGLSFVAILITIFRGSGAIGGEIQRGTILAEAARPVARGEIVVGKIIGIVAVGAVLFTVLGAASVVAAGILTGTWVEQAGLAIALLDLNLAMVGAVAIAASVRFSPMVATVTVLATYFGITNIDKLYAFGVFADSQALQQGAIWGRLLLPVGETSDVAAGLLAGPITGLTADLVRGGAMAGFEPRSWIVAYAAAYLGAVVALGCVGLLRRDLR